ncbi:ABC transporter substrate-binding protein [Mesorhizobium tianshanense]|nr:ABC transporter substrate-binding protein [Mesorhizobium tianshanense]
MLAGLPKVRAADETPRRGGVLRAATSEEPFAPAFDVHKVDSLLTTRIGYLAYNGLVNVNERREIEPDLAESWEQPDALTYIFKLRKGVLFHDGTEFDADAVKFNLERIINPETASPKRADFAVIKTIDVVDKYTVKLHLDHPFAPLLGYMRRSYFGIMSPKAITEQMGQDPLKRSIGTGPFKFVSYTRGDKVILERFDKYFGTPAWLDGIEIRIMPEQSTQFAALQTGSLDYMIQTSPSFAEQMKYNPDLQVLSAPSTIWDFLAFNVMRAPFTDKRVRQAFSMALDREAMAKGVYRGYAKAAQGALSSGFSPYFRDNGDIPFQTYDPDRAKALLKEADFPFQSELRFDTFTERPWGQIGDAIADQISALGVKLRIEKPDFNTFAQYFYGTKEYWFGNSSMTGGGADPDELMYKQFVTGEVYNINNYTNPEVDKLLKDARTENDVEKRVDLYNKANRMLMEECCVAFLVYPDLVEGMRANVHGYRFRDESAGTFDECWLS